MKRTLRLVVDYEEAPGEVVDPQQGIGELIVAASKCNVEFVEVRINGRTAMTFDARPRDKLPPRRPAHPG